jgi:hypothetical protein
MTIRYAEHAPREKLRPWVRCVWAYEDPSPSDIVQRIPPDGCAELIVHLATPYEERRANGRFVRQPSVIFAGQMTKPIRLRASGPVACIGLRFEPDGAQPWFGKSMTDATDQRLDVSARLPAAADFKTTDDVMNLLQDEVFAALTSAGWPSDRSLRADIARLRAGKPPIERDATARRRMQRLYARQVGVSPQMLQSVFRFRRVFDKAAEPGAGNWLHVALDAGYFDQPQMAHDFQRFLGCTATQWAREQIELARAIASQPSV